MMFAFERDLPTSIRSRITGFDQKEEGVKICRHPFLSVPNVIFDFAVQAETFSVRPCRIFAITSCRRRDSTFSGGRMLKFNFASARKN